MKWVILIIIALCLVACYVVTVADAEDGEPMTLGEYIITNIYERLCEFSENDELTQCILTGLDKALHHWDSSPS